MALGAQGCGESGVVASGVSTYETADALGTVMVERSVTRCSSSVSAVLLFSLEVSDPKVYEPRI